MLFTLYYQASWSIIQQVLYLTLNSLGRKTKKEKKKNKLLSFFFFFFQHCNYISALQSFSRSKILKVSMWFKGMNVNYEYVTMNDHQEQPDGRHSSL